MLNLSLLLFTVFTPPVTIIIAASVVITLLLIALGIFASATRESQATYDGLYTDWTALDARLQGNTARMYKAEALVTSQQHDLDITHTAGATVTGLLIKSLALLDTLHTFASTVGDLATAHAKSYVHELLTHQKAVDAIVYFTAYIIGNQLRLFDVARLKNQAGQIEYEFDFNPTEKFPTTYNCTVPEQIPGLPNLANNKNLQARLLDILPTDVAAEYKKSRAQTVHDTMAPVSVLLEMDATGETLTTSINELAKEVMALTGGALTGEYVDDLTDAPPDTPDAPPAESAD